MKPEIVAKLKKYNAKIPAALERESEGIAKRLRKPRIEPLEGLAILYELVDRYAEYSRGLVACKSGCTYCCHAEVAMSGLEADYIAAHAGVVKMKPFVLLDGKSGHYCDPSRPCSFLAPTGLCAIYEHRPMMCRTQWSFEGTSEPCSFAAPQDGSIAFLDRGKSWPKPMEAYFALIEKHDKTWADIRQWFPNGLVAR